MTSEQQIIDQLKQASSNAKEIEVGHAQSHHDRYQALLHYKFDRDLIKGLYEAAHLIPPSNLLGLITNAIQELQALTGLDIETVERRSHPLLRSVLNIHDIK